MRARLIRGKDSGQNRTADWKRRISAILITVGVIVISDAAPRFAPDRVPPTADEVHAQGTGEFHAHLPWTARNADISADPSPPWQSDADFVIGGPAWTVDVVGDIAYVGVGAHLLAYDISVEGSMPLLGASPPLSGSVRDVEVQDGFAFVAVSQIRHIPEAPGGLFVLDVHDPAAIDVVARRTWVGGATDIDINGERAVLVSMNGDVDNAIFLSVFDIGDPMAPQITNWSGRGSGQHGDAVFVGDMVYVCGEELRIFDPDSPSESWFSIESIGTSVFAAGFAPGVGGLLIEVDVSEPDVPRVVSSRSDMAVGLSVDGNSDLIVIAGAQDASGPTEFLHEKFDEGRLEVLGSRVTKLLRGEDRALREAAVVAGPGTLLSTVECAGDLAYVFEVSPKRDGLDRLWALDSSSGHPETISSIPSNSLGDVLEEGPMTAQATGSDLYAEIGGRVTQYRAYPAAQIMGTTEDDGVVAVSGGHLFVMTEGGVLNIYDIGAPGEWPLVGSLDFDGEKWSYLGPYAMVEHGGSLWVATTYADRPFRTTVALIDVSDPTHPRLGGTLEIEEPYAGPKYLTLTVHDEVVWMLSSDEGRATVRRLTSDADDLTPRVLEQWGRSGGTVVSLPFSAFPFSFAVQDDIAWFVSPAFLHGTGEVYAVERTAESGLRWAGGREAPAAVRAQSTDAFDNKSESYGGLSIAACGERILGTDLEGGLYGIDPERWLEGVGDE